MTDENEKKIRVRVYLSQNLASGEIFHRQLMPYVGKSIEIVIRNPRKVKGFEVKCPNCGKNL